MPAARLQNGPEKRRRTHMKSRRGCGNCKLRRVKCDEAKPHCKKCVVYGVSCSYDSKRASLDLSAQGAFQVDFSIRKKQEDSETLSSPDLVPREPLVSANECIVSMLNERLERGSSTSQLPFGHYTVKDLEVFQRFQSRTVLTIGSGRGAPIYRDFISPMALKYPFLMHMLLSFTLMHDAHLSTPSPFGSSKYQRTSLHHWNTATILFNRVLSLPIDPDSRDALWATAALIGSNVFAYVEAPDYEQSWPLKPSDPDDLSWLKLSEGKKAIWKLADPTRKDSRFNIIAEEMNRNCAPKWMQENDISAIPSNARRLFNIDEASTIENNPYHLPTLLLTNLQYVPPTHDNVLEYLFFMGFLSSNFHNLLTTKDPRALILLRWWYKRLETSNLWWLTRRATVEGGAVHIWLERWYGEDAGLKEMFDKLGRTNLSCKEGVEFSARFYPQDSEAPEILL